MIIFPKFGFSFVGSDVNHDAGEIAKEVRREGLWGKCVYHWVCISSLNLLDSIYLVALL